MESQNYRISKGQKQTALYLELPDDLYKQLNSYTQTTNTSKKETVKKALNLLFTNKGLNNV